MAKLKYYMNTRVAGFQYHEGLLCYDELKIGRELTMQREPMEQRAQSQACLSYAES